MSSIRKSIILVTIILLGIYIVMLCSCKKEYSNERTQPIVTPVCGIVILVTLNNAVVIYNDSTTQSVRGLNFKVGDKYCK